MMKKALRILLIITHTTLILCLFGYTIFKVHGFTYNIEENEIQLTSIIDIITYPRGAELYLDSGKYNGKTNTIIRPEPGKHTISLKKEGFVTFEKEIEVLIKEATQLEVFLLPDYNIKTPKKLLKNVYLIGISPFDKNITALVDNEHNRIVVYDTSKEKITDIIPISDKILKIKWYDSETITYQFEDRSIQTYNIWNKKQISKPLSVNNFKKYFGDNTRFELSRTLPFLKGKVIENFYLDWQDQSIILNDTHSINECDIQNETCQTLIRFSDPIVKTIYIEGQGILIQHENRIQYYDYEGVRELMPLSDSIEIEYLPKTKEILFTSKGTLFRWQVFYK